MLALNNAPMPASQFADNAAFTLLHLLNIDLDRPGLNAVFGRMLSDPLKAFGTVQQRLRWNATDIKAGAP